MGYQRSVLKLKFEDPEFEGFEVRMKRMSVDDMLYLTSLKDIRGESETEEGLAKMLEILAEGILSWNLEDEQGNPVAVELGHSRHPAAPECCSCCPEDRETHPATGLYAQDMDLIIQILNTWVSVIKVSRPLPKTSNSGGPFPEEFELMAPESVSPENLNVPA